MQMWQLLTLTVELANVRLFGCFCSGDSARKVSFEKVEADRSDVMGIACVALMSCILLAIVVMDICSLWRRPGRVVVAKQRSPHTHRPIHTQLKTRNRRSRGYALNLHQYWRWTLKGSKFSIVANIALFLVNLQVLGPPSLSYCLHRLRQWTEHFMLLLGLPTLNWGIPGLPSLPCLPLPSALPLLFLLPPLPFPGGRAP